MSLVSRRIRQGYGLIGAMLSLTPLSAFGQPKGIERVASTPDWRQRIEGCFYSGGNVNTILLNQFVREAEASRAKDINGAVSLETAAPESVLADAYLQQGRFDDARTLLSHSRVLVGDNGHVSPLPSTPAYKTWRAVRLAAIAVAQRHYSEAALQYLSWIGYRLLYVAFQPVMLSMLVLILWRLKPGIEPFVMSRGSYVVIGLACMPVWTCLVHAVLEPLTSLLLFGGVGKFITNHRCWYVVDSLYSIEFEAALLAVAVLLNREVSKMGHESGSDERVSPVLNAHRSLITGRSAVALLVLVVSGTILAGGQRFGVAPTFWYQRYVRLADVWWWVSMFGMSVAAPICEEALYRGVLHRTASRLMYPLFGAFVSAIAFAGSHLDNTAFLSHVWFGVACAVLYEIRKSIWLPAAVRGLNNLCGRW